MKQNPLMQNTIGYKNFKLYYDDNNDDIVLEPNENTLALGEVQAKDFYDAVSAMFLKLEKIQRKNNSARCEHGLISCSLNAIRRNYPEALF